MTKTAIYQQLLLLAALPAFMLASCTQEEMGVEQDKQSGEIRFEIGFAPQNGAMQTDAQTRVATNTEFNSTWENGDEIGVFAVEHGTELAASGNYIHNVKLTYNEDGVWTGPAYWPTLTSGISKLDFYAYYPYNANAANPLDIRFNVHTDQSEATDNKSNYNLSDLLTAKNAKADGYSRDEVVELSISHALAMVQVDVSQSMKGNSDPKALKVWLNGCTTDCGLNLSTQSATQPADKAFSERIKMYPCPNNDAAPGIFAYRALVPVQTIASGTALFSFECNGTIVRSQPLTEALELHPSKAETFDITFPFTSVTVSSTERITDFLSDDELAGITHLKVFGEMTEEDFVTIQQKIDAINILDLSGATVKEGAIPEKAFSNKKSLKEFFFPQGITSIGKEAFKECTELTGSITIPVGVQTIGMGAFMGCKKVTGSLTIPESVTLIGSGAFMNCKGVTSIFCNIPNPSEVKFEGAILMYIPKDIPVYVPAAAMEEYKKHKEWNGFKNLHSIPQS